MHTIMPSQYLRLHLKKLLKFEKTYIQILVRPLTPSHVDLFHLSRFKLKFLLSTYNIYGVFVLGKQSFHITMAKLT